MSETATSLRATILALIPAQSAEFPLERYEYIMSCYQRVQHKTGRKYATKIDREKGVVNVTRTDKGEAENPAE